MKTTNNIPKVSIIIINWNGWKDTIACLESVYQSKYNNFDVIVIDNASKNDSVLKIRKYCQGTINVTNEFINFQRENKPITLFEVEEQNFPNIIIPDNFGSIPSNKKLILLKNKNNLGFTGGNNIGLRFVMQKLKSDYILLLNNDTVVQKDFLLELVKIAEENSKIGSVQSKILSFYNPVIVDARGIILTKFAYAYQIDFNKPDNVKNNVKREIFGGCGAAVLYRIKMLKEIGFFDDDFFAYFEDVDLSWRAQLFGWKSFFAPRSIIYHKFSASGNNVKEYYISRNQMFYILKNASTIQILLSLIKIFFDLPKALIISKRRAGKGLPNGEVRKMRLKGKFDMILKISKMLIKRKQLSKKIKRKRKEVENKWLRIPNYRP